MFIQQNFIVTGSNFGDYFNSVKTFYSSPCNGVVVCIYYTSQCFFSLQNYLTTSLM